MKTRFKKGAKVFDIMITAVAGMFSVGMMLYGVYHFGLGEAWPELVLNLFYIACLAPNFFCKSLHYIYKKADMTNKNSVPVTGYAVSTMR